jgi:hypothetical protein
MLIRRRLETEAATCFVGVCGADEQAIGIFDEPLSSIRWRPASNADRQSFCDVLGDA